MGFKNPEVLFDTVIVRLGGEIGIKSAWTRRTYEKRLIQNIKATLKHHNIPYENIIRQQGRIYIKTSQAKKAALKLTKVFGISSLSPTSQTTSRLEDITAQSLKLAKRKLQKQNSFAVKCKRVGTHPYTSRDICQQIGQEILEVFQKLQLKVNLTNPDNVIGIEIRQNNAYIYTDIIAAPDGLPIGTQPKTIALIKPDMNSPVACWLTMKRGCPSVPVYFSENQNKTAIKQAKNICKALFEWSIGHTTKLYLIPHNQNLIMLKQKCPPYLLGIIEKRLIYRIASHIAEKEKAEAIVTGETIGEKSYQTLRHFKLQDQAIRDYPIHRPLTGLNSAEIKKLAHRIGIPKALTTTPKKSQAIIPKEAALPTLREVEVTEKKLNIQKMINATIEQLETVTI
ncbi:MAG: THUMP domain-containing protein [Candidatus Bathyarchaeota archaeon]|nr:THUMP domain-containing protein [Candidatus Bathyarchaeota archaeon]